MDYCHYITDDKPNDDCNKHHVMLPKKRGSKRGTVEKNARFEYTEAEILRLVNSLGASFDAVKVVPDLGGYTAVADGGLADVRTAPAGTLEVQGFHAGAVKVVPDLGGYRVFPEDHSCDGPDGYNYGDEFQFDSEMTARREAVYTLSYQLTSSVSVLSEVSFLHRFQAVLQGISGIRPDGPVFVVASEVAEQMQEARVVTVYPQGEVREVGPGRGMDEPLLSIGSVLLQLSGLQVHHRCMQNPRAGRRPLYG